MHRILVRPTVQLQYGTARFFVEEISKKVEVFLFCEVNYFGTEKWKKNALEKMLNWKRQFFWRKQPLSGRIFLKEYYTSHPYQQAKLKSTLFAFYYSMLLSLSGSLNQASMQTFQEDWKNYFERYLKIFASLKGVDPSIKGFIRSVFIFCVFELKI